MGKRSFRLFGMVGPGIAVAATGIGAGDIVSATGTTLLEGWMRHLGRTARFYFFVYLVIWSFVVGGALISACGLAGHALFMPFLAGTLLYLMNKREWLGDHRNGFGSNLALALTLLLFLYLAAAGIADRFGS